MADVVQDKDGRIHMLNEAGSPVSVDAADYHDAVASGWKPQTVEQYNQHATAKEQSGIGQTALAAGEGALETSTLGLGTKAAVALGGEGYRQKAQERAEAHPTARAVGQVAGAVVPGLLSGGEGTAAEIAGLTPAGALSRASGALEGAVASGLERAGVGGAGGGLLGAMVNRGAALGAQGALEGAAYGVGGTVAQSALEDTDWTAERALSGLEDGALYGLATGAAIGAGGALVSRAGRAAADAMLGEGTTLKQTVQNWADKRTVKGLVGDDAEAFRKITRNGEDMSRVGDLATKLRDRGVATAKDIPGALEGEIGAANQVSKTIEQGAEAAGVRPDTAGMLDDLREQVTALRNMDTPDHDAVASLLEKRLKRFEAGMKPDQDLAAVAKLGLENADYLKTGMRPESIERVRAEHASGQPMRPVDVTRYPDGQIALNDGRHRLAVARELGLTEIPTHVSVMDAEGNIIRETTGSLPLAPGEAPSSLPSFEDLRSFKTATGVTIDWAKSNARLATNEARKFYGTIAQTLEQTAEQMGPEAGTAYRGAMRDMDDFITVKKAMQRENVRASRAKFMQGTDVQSGMGGALAALVLGHSGPMAALAGIATSAASKFVRERGAQGIGKIADWAVRSEQGMRAAADKMAGLGKLDSTALRAAIQLHDSPKKQEEHFQSVQGAVMAYQQDPQSLGPRIQKAIGPIAHEQPEVAIAMGREITNDYQYLASLAPRPMSRAPDSLTPTKEKVTYSIREKTRMVNAAKALASPQSVWASVAGGHVNWDGLKALKERRPQQWQDMRNHVIRAVNQADKPLTLRRRTLLGVAFEFKSDWSLANVAAIQAVGAQPPDQGNGKPSMSAMNTSANDLPGQPGAEESSAA